MYTYYIYVNIIIFEDENTLKCMRYFNQNIIQHEYNKSNKSNKPCIMQSNVVCYYIILMLP